MPYIPHVSAKFGINTFSLIVSNMASLNKPNRRYFGQNLYFVTLKRELYDKCIFKRVFITRIVPRNINHRQHFRFNRKLYFSPRWTENFVTEINFDIARIKPFENLNLRLRVVYPFVQDKGISKLFFSFVLC